MLIISHAKIAILSLFYNILSKKRLPNFLSLDSLINSLTH